MLTTERKNFNRLVTFVSIISIIGIAIFGISSVFMLMLFIALLFIPEAKINEWIQMLPNFKTDGTMIEIDNVKLDGLELAGDIVYNKLGVLVTIGLAVLSAALLLYIAIVIYRWMKNMKSGEIFTIQNSKYVINIGVLLIIMTLLDSIGSTVESFVTYKMVEKIIESNNIEYSFNVIDINFMLLGAGIIVLIIGYVFKYGTFLQEEYDSTI